MIQMRKLDSVGAGEFWVLLCTTPLASAAVNLELEVNASVNPHEQIYLDPLIRNGGRNQR
jgi:hypothetical protein